jgi:hypothetical protein
MTGTKIADDADGSLWSSLILALLFAVDNLLIN